MITRDIDKDIEHSDPWDKLVEVHAKVAPLAMVWHAMLLPIVRTNGVPRVVLTGHIVCHDCELCAVAGDFRDGGHVVPWRSQYGDCTDDDGEGDDYFNAYRDAVTGRQALPDWALESLRACYYVVAGNVLATGYKLDPDRLNALDERVITSPEVSGSRVSSLYGLVDVLYSEAPRAPLPDALYLPPVVKADAPESAPSAAVSAPPRAG